MRGVFKKIWEDYVTGEQGRDDRQRVRSERRPGARLGSILRAIVTILDFLLVLMIN